MRNALVQRVGMLCRCGGRVTGGTCDRCGPRRESRSRTSNPYGRRWQRFRASYLADNPLCTDCEQDGRVTFATEVHHVCKVQTHPELMYETTNVRGLCQRCHSIRTRRGE